ncbi:MAG: hypothetical protein ABIS06_00435 [Vicinamibacterales bacterium]
MKRREFVEKLGIGSVGIAAAAAAAAAIGRGTGVSAQNQHAHDSFQIDGPLASATVSFGQWMMPLDRFTGVSSTRTSNQHKVIPYQVKIKAGGSVNYIISGVHLILVYAPGTTIDDLNRTLIEGASATFPGFLADATNRIYRGVDPRGTTPLDRVEVVTFTEPGTYLVVCGVIAHLNTNMYGYVTVLP